MNASGALSATGVAAVAALLALYLHRKKVWPKPIIVLAFVAGLGVAGTVGSATDWVGERILAGASSSTKALFGVGTPIVIVLIGGLALFFAFKPKGPGPTKWSAPIAFILPTLLIATGGASAQAGSALQDGFGAATQGSMGVLSDLAASLNK